MTITRGQLPQAFMPYAELTVCGNRVIGGGHLIAIGDVLPLLVGRGQMIWLQAKLREDGDFALLVDGSIPRVPGIAVFTRDDALYVVAGSVTLLRIKETSPESAVIDMLDLRPVGLNIFGDKEQLMAGGATFNKNTFAGGGVVIAT